MSANRGQSARRKMSRGTLKMIWNSTFKRMDFYKKAKASGKWLLSTADGSRFLQFGPGHHTLTLKKWETD